MDPRILQTLDKLKPRELEVLHLIASGLTNEEIAVRLCIEVTTVRWHNRQIYSKLGVHSRTLAVALARRSGLLNDEPPPSLSSQRPVPGQKSNLPAQVTTLIGREHEILFARQMLAACRLLTLTGPGGIGKTRLALRIAELVKDEYADGVWYFPMASLFDANLVANKMADVLKISDTAGDTVEASLINYLESKHALLIVDNFEYLIAAAGLFSNLLAGAASIKILVTSRQVLNLYGEQKYTVPPLALPTLHQSYAADQLAQFDAIRLFLERAHASNPAFRATAQNVEIVAAICARLDGLPLALELAASQVRLRAPQQLLIRLEHNFDTLGIGPGDVPARHRTLRATIDWSYNLLTSDEKILFNRVGVFRGGWTVHVMEAICTDGLALDVFDVLAALIDKSLVGQETVSEGEPYFTLLETIREYAVERLIAMNELDLLQERHAKYYAQLYDSAPIGKDRAIQKVWIRRLHSDYDNVRAALEWSVQHDPNIGLSMIHGLLPFWDMYGFLIEGMHWTRRLLSAEQDPIPSVRLKALVHASEIAGLIGDHDSRARFSEEALTLAQHLGDPLLLGWALLEQADAAIHQQLPSGDFTKPQRLAEVALDIFYKENAPFHAAMTLNALGQCARATGDDERAQHFYEEGIRLLRALDDQFFLQIILFNLGIVALRHAEYDDASSHFLEALTISQQMNDIRCMVISAEALALIMGITSNALHAAQLLGAAEELRRQQGIIVRATDAADYERYMKMIRARIDQQIFAAAFTTGRGLPLDQLINGINRQ